MNVEGGEWSVVEYTKYILKLMMMIFFFQK